VGPRRAALTPVATAEFDDLRPGMFFVYAGPRRWFVLPTAGAGQILGLEPEHGVVHVRLFWPAPDTEDGSERLEPAVGHLPILWSRFRSSLRQLLDHRPVPLDARESLLSWRARRAKDEVGAFDVPLWRALQLAWETVLVPDAVESSGEAGAPSPDNLLIAFAFPKRGADGTFRVVEVSAVPRLPRDDADQ